MVGGKKRLLIELSSMSNLKRYKNFQQLVMYKRHTAHSLSENSKEALQELRKTLIAEA